VENGKISHPTYGSIHQDWQLIYYPLPTPKLKIDNKKNMSITILIDTSLDQSLSLFKMFET
jgi:hypothetical protein